MNPIAGSAVGSGRPRAFRHAVAFTFAALVLAGCTEPRDEFLTTRLFVMATQVDLTLPASATAREPRLIADIEQELREFERDYYAWGDGELARLNRALTAVEPFAASAAMTALLADAQAIARTTDRAFEPGVGPLVELWGFHAGEPANAPPPAASIAATLAASGSILDLVIDDHSVRVAEVAGGRLFKLDLGGIAKGAAVDRIVARLEARGIAQALVNAGGDLRVIGMPAGRRWRIGIQATRSDSVLGTIELDPGEAAFTSGDYERYFDFDGARLHHILDPKTGAPVMHTQAVTVIAASGTLADAAATALLVAGPDDWRRVAAGLGIAAALRVDAAGQIEVTGAMRDRFQPNPEVASDIIVVPD